MGIVDKVEKIKKNASKLEFFGGEVSCPRV